MSDPKVGTDSLRELERLRALEAAVTPAPWHGHDTCCGVVFGPAASGSTHILEAFAGPNRSANRDLAYEVRNRLPALLDLWDAVRRGSELECLHGAEQEIRAALEALENPR